MPHQPLISVIIPIYQAEQFLGQAIESLLAQEGVLFEGLLIDDGSTDGSAQICRQYTARDNRLRYIRQSNQGISGARNTGLDNAQGHYVFFLDADDVLPACAFRGLLYHARQNNTEITIGKSIFTPAPSETDARLQRKQTLGTSVVLTPGQVIKRVLYQQGIPSSMWSILFKTAIFNGPDPLRFTPGLNYEDLDIVYRAFARASKITVASTPAYLYRANPNSFMHTWSAKRYDVLKVTNTLLAYMKEHHPSLTSAALDRRFAAHYNIMVEMIRNHVDDPVTLARCQKVVHQGRARALYDPHVRLKNKLGALVSYFGLPAIRFFAKQKP